MQRTSTNSTGQSETDKRSVKLLRAHEAADQLAISARKLWQLTSEGRIACIRLGRSVRYDPEDLRRFIESQRERADAEPSASTYHESA